MTPQIWRSPDRNTARICDTVDDRYRCFSGSRNRVLRYENLQNVGGARFEELYKYYKRLHKNVHA